jgi:hypothetical protein
MEDVIKMLKVEYLNNRLLDLTKILNLSLYDQIIFCNSCEWKWPPIEDDLQILKVEYLCTLYGSWLMIS